MTLVMDRFVRPRVSLPGIMPSVQNAGALPAPTLLQGDPDHFPGSFGRFFAAG